MTILRAATAVAVLLVLSGCASNPVVGHANVQAGRYVGDVGLAGNGSLLTIQAGSKVSKLSIVGDAARVTVEDGAEVWKIEFWGNGSTVSIPENMEVTVASMGTNEVNRRSASGSPESQPSQ